MEAKELVLKSLEQSQRTLTRALDGLTPEEVAFCPGVECNNIAFILWHTTRVEDMMISRMIQGQTGLYESEGWGEKLGTPAKAFQYTAEELQNWPVPDMAVLREYVDAVRQKTLAVLEAITPEKLSEPLSPERPGTAGDTLGRMSTEIAMHVGQIAYLRGMQRGLDK